MPALHLDVALIHATRADERVSVKSQPDHYMDDWFARASAHTIVSVDEMVDSTYFNDPDVARRVYWERNVTSQVVHLEGGAHPSSSDPLYGFDVSHYKTYGGLMPRAGTPHGRMLS